jgi:uncharacterized protein
LQGQCHTIGRATLMQARFAAAVARPERFTYPRRVSRCFAQPAKLARRPSLRGVARGTALEAGHDMLVVLALAVLIGISLGLLGGGGSILTVPILAYVAGMDAKEAIAASLFVVAVTSAAGVLSHARAGRVKWRTGILFGAAGMGGAFAGGRLAAFIPGNILMIAFGLMMAATAIAMLRGGTQRKPFGGELPVGKVIVEGVVVGLVTGIVGAGGGFLVVPALVLLGGLSMETAVGTSLVVISMKSFAGLAGHLGHVDLDWKLTLGVTAAAVVGSVIGGSLAGRIPPTVLRRGFGIFIIVMAVLVIAKELL